MGEGAAGDDEAMLAWQLVSAARLVLFHGAAFTSNWRIERALAKSCLGCQLNAQRTQLSSEERLASYLLASSWTSSSAL